jgi:catechol 2,3-dioxygenase-like lactoylglutathione lyase family enzyme
MPNSTPTPLANSTISYLFLYVHDLARMLTFYRDQLGLTVYFEQAGVCAFLQTTEGQGPAIALCTGPGDCGGCSAPAGCCHWGHYH